MQARATEPYRASAAVATLRGANAFNAWARTCVGARFIASSTPELTGQALLARLHRGVCRSRYLVKMSHSHRICAVLAVCALLAHVGNAQTSAPAPAPGTVLESDAAAAAAYPISTQEELPLTDSATLPVTCNMTLIGLSATSTAAVSAAGRRLQASTNTSRGLGTADIHCVGSYNVTVTGGPALVDFVSGWTGMHCDVFEVSHPSIR